MSVLRRFCGALLLGAMVLTVAGFASGQLASVVTLGTSMQPSYAAGDLVVVMRADRYHHGDVVAYRDGARGEVVLHRIVGGDSSAFELRGDNNQSSDPETPGAADLLGREIVHLPKIGRWIGSPLMLAVTAGALIAVAGMATIGGGGSGRARQTGSDSQTAAGPRMRWPHLLLIVADLGVAAGLVAALLAPPTVIPPPPPAMHEGSFSYGSEVAPSETYPSGRIETGDSVFVNLADRVDITFTYDGDASLPAGARMNLVLDAATGWTTSRPLAPLTAVIDGSVVLRGTIDITSLRALLDRVHLATGLTLSSVQLRVEAIVEPDVSLRPDVSTFRHDLAFRFDDLGLAPVDSTIVTQSPSGPVVAASTPVRDVVEEPTEVGGVPREARRWLVVVLLVLVAATATSWPTGDHGAHRTGHHRSRRSRSGTTGRAREIEDPVPVTLVADVELPDDRMRVRLATRADLVQMAREADAPLLVRDDGWCALVSDRAVHWWAPDAGSAVGPIEAVTTSPQVAPQMRTLADVWAVEPPRFAPDHDLAPHELPTTEMRIDVVEQLRDEMLAPRRPLFADRPPAPLAAPAAPPAAPAPPPAVSAAPTPGSDDPLRTTIDEIVAYLSEVAPRPQGDAHDLAS